MAESVAASGPPPPRAVDEEMGPSPGSNVDEGVVRERPGMLGVGILRTSAVSFGYLHPL